MRTRLLTVLVLATSPAAAQAPDTIRLGSVYRTLASAVASARPGAVVIVPAGTRVESGIVIDRALTIAGEPGAVVDGGGGEILRIVADGVRVRGLTLRNVATSFVEDPAAIRVVEAADCVLEDNTILDTFFAIYLQAARDCVVRNNRIRGSETRQTAAGNGIHAWKARGLEITANDIAGHRDGIYFEFVNDSRVRDNTSRSNLRYGLHFMFSDGCRYERNAFVGNGAGVAVMYARHVSMLGNRFEGHRGSASYGLLLKDITDSEVLESRFANNTVGVMSEGSNRITIETSTFVDNGWAIRLMANAEDHRFADNTFAGNTFDVATNSRRTHGTFEGNHWDRYTGYDMDGDGLGDIPFRPVRLFSLIVERHPPAIALLRSLFVDLLDAAERLLPVLTPVDVVDPHPRMRPLPARLAGGAP